VSRDTLVIGALLTGVAGIITAWASLVRARHEGDHQCEERLREARAEAEQYAQRLHTERMRALEEGER
jgi:hypothetical protein